MSVAPRNPIVQPTARRGRPSRDDVESSTATGRTLHWFETRILDGVKFLTAFEQHFERELLLDADCDRLQAQAIALITCSCCVEPRALLLQARERDALRDEANLTGARYVRVGLRGVFRALGAMVERSAVALRGGK